MVNFRCNFNLFCVHKFSDRINEKLSALNYPTIFDSIQTKSMSKVQQLCLCMYLIEQEFHFTGDGIWSDSSHNLDPSITTMPELPAGLVSNNRFGKKRQKNIIDLN